ncbi:MAG TPA: Holliday junction resolvase RuvX [Burkholderiales bacterium]|nr:Holliday junction resolvase RuvX [Burkholderiales bacterium]
MHSTGGTVLAFDYGRRRVGVAVGDPAVGIAHALEVIDAAGDRRFLRIAALVEQWRPARFVVGLPVAEDGGPHPLDRAVRTFARRLTGRFGIPVEFWDERYSSTEASAALREAGVGGKAQKPRLDGVAAAVILQAYLDHENARS